MKSKYWPHAVLAGLFCTALSAHGATGGPEQDTLGDVLWEHEVTIHSVPEDAQAEQVALAIGPDGLVYAKTRFENTVVALDPKAESIKRQKWKIEHWPHRVRCTAECGQPVLAVDHKNQLYIDSYARRAGSAGPTQLLLSALEWRDGASGPTVHWDRAYPNEAGFAPKLHMPVVLWQYEAFLSGGRDGVKSTPLQTVGASDGLLDWSHDFSGGAVQQPRFGQIPDLLAPNWSNASLERIHDGNKTTYARGLQYRAVSFGAHKDDDFQYVYAPVGTEMGNDRGGNHKRRFQVLLDKLEADKTQSLSLYRDIWLPDADMEIVSDIVTGQDGNHSPDNDIAYVAARKQVDNRWYSKLYAIDVRGSENGAKVLWEYALDGKKVVGAPTLGAKGTLYVSTVDGTADKICAHAKACTQEGSVYAVDGRNGQLRWYTDITDDLMVYKNGTDEPITPPTLGEDGMVYVGIQQHETGKSSDGTYDDWFVKVVALKGDQPIASYGWPKEHGNLGNTGTVAQWYAE